MGLGTPRGSQDERRPIPVSSRSGEGRREISQYSPTMTGLPPSAARTALARSQRFPTLSWRPQVRFQRGRPETLASGEQSTSLGTALILPAACRKSTVSQKPELGGGSWNPLSPSPGSRGAHNAPPPAPPKLLSAPLQTRSTGRQMEADAGRSQIPPTASRSGSTMRGGGVLTALGERDVANLRSLCLELGTLPSAPSPGCPGWP